MSEIRQLPNSIEAEQSVLGALLRDNDAIDRIGDLRPEHFFVGDHAVIFEEILRNVVAGRSVDMVSIMALLEGRVHDIKRYVTELAQAMPSSANIARYAGIVRDRAVKRALIAFAREVEERAMNPAVEAAAVLDYGSSRIEKIAVSRVRQEPVRAVDDLAAHIDELNRRMEGGTRAIPTGFTDVDEKLNGGPRRGELHVIAARPKMGKTGFALNIACHAAIDYSVLVLSMEMPRAQLHDRNIAALGGIPLPHLLKPSKMDDGDWARLSAAVGKIEVLNLFLDDQGGLRLMDVRMKAKLVKRRHGLDMLVIDYLQLMEGDGDNRNAQIEGITRGLKALAKELDIAILLLSQLNRDLEKRPNKRPQPSDLRDSGAIEQDADSVTFLYRDEVYHPDSPDKGMCEVDVALCRQGAPGRVALGYVGEQTKFVNLDRPWVPQPPAERQRRGLAREL